MVVRQLHRRLGTIAPEIEERVRHLSVDRVEDLGEALFDLETEADWVRSIEETEG